MARPWLGQHYQQGIPVNGLDPGTSESPEIAGRPEASMTFQLVIAQIRLAGFKFGSAQEHRFGGLGQGVLQKIESFLLGKVLNNIAKENQVVMIQSGQDFPGISHMNAIIKKSMHLRQISGMPLDSIDADLPMFPLITGRLVFGFINIRVFPKKMTPFAKANPHVQNGTGIDLP